jgi:hypothetical protein
MKSYEYKEIHLTDNKMFAKHFDEFTAKNIVLMNWWKHIGTSSIEKL